MKYLVTGGTGFLGRHVAWRLAGLGHDVTFTGRNSHAAREVRDLSPASVRFVEIDHGSTGAAVALNNAVTGCDAVVHCAALSSPWGRRQDFVRANIESTREVIAACRLARIQRLVHISTPSIYFNFSDRLGVRENEPLPPPVNEYARTKFAAECLVREAALPATTILRPRALFGPWDNTLLPRLLRVIEKGVAPIMRGGKALIDITCVDNAVDAVLLALRRTGDSGADTFNISNGSPIAIGELFTEFARAFGLPLRSRRVPHVLAHGVAGVMEFSALLLPGWEPPLTRYSVGTIAFSQTLDLSHARAALGYAPRIGFEEGLQRTVAWWRSQRGVTS